MAFCKKRLPTAWNTSHQKCASLFLTIGLLLKVVKKDRKSPGLLTEVGDDSTGSSDGLLNLTIGIQLGQSAPSTEVLSRVNHDNGDLTLSAQSTDELLVLFVLTVLGKAAKTGGAAVEGLGTFMETLAESVMNEGLFEDLLQGIQDVHLGDFFFDLFGGDFDLFVRHGWNIGGGGIKMTLTLRVMGLLPQGPKVRRWKKQ